MDKKRERIWAIPGVRVAVVSAGLVAFMAVAQTLSALVDLGVFADNYDGDGFAALFIVGFFAVTLVVNCVGLVLAVIDLRRGGLRVGLAVWSGFCLLGHVFVAWLLIVAGDVRPQWYHVTVLVYEPVTIALAVAILVLSCLPGRWKWGIREIGRRARGYYVGEPPYPVIVEYRPPAGDRPVAPPVDYRPEHL